MNLDVRSLLVGLIVAAIVFVVAGLFLPAPLPLLLALLVLVAVLFGGVGL